MELYTLIILSTLIMLGLGTKADKQPKFTKSNANILKFPYGVNLKYNGEIQHGIQRMWVVTTVKVPSEQDIQFDRIGFNKNCPWISSHYLKNINVKHKQDSVQLNAICSSVGPMIEWFEQKEMGYIKHIRKLLGGELYAIFPELSAQWKDVVQGNPLNRNKRNIRSSHVRPEHYPVRAKTSEWAHLRVGQTQGSGDSLDEGFATPTLGSYTDPKSDATGRLTRDDVDLLQVNGKNDTKSMLIRPKRSIWPIFAPLVGGLIKIATEGISSWLARKREKAQSQALDKIRQSQEIVKNRIFHYEKEFLMYGQYNIDTLEDIIETMNNLSWKQDIYESMFNRDIRSKPGSKDWPQWYLDNFAGPAKFATHLNTYLMSVAEKQQAVYEPLIRELETFFVAISKLSKGYLPPEIFTPLKIRDIIIEVKATLREKFPNYEMALTRLSTYYDLKLATFDIDVKQRELVITFPVFIHHKSNKRMKLYEKEIVPVPVPDLNLKANTYTEVLSKKPYIAANEDNYIELRIQELRMCKTINQVYFCEETFLQKSKEKHSCMSTLLYDMPDKAIEAACNIAYYYNTTVTPSVLDGGDEIVLANILGNKLLDCDKDYHLPVPLTDEDYVKINKSMLCKCKIHQGKLSGDNVQILRSLTACAGSVLNTQVQHTINLPFLFHVKEFISNDSAISRVARNLSAMMHREDYTSPILNKEDYTFPIYCKSYSNSTDPNIMAKAKQSLQTLKQVHSFMREDFQRNTIEKEPTPLYTRKTASQQLLHTLGILVTIAIASILLIIGFVYCKHSKLSALVGGMAMQPYVQTSVAEAQQMAHDKALEEEDCPNVSFICQHPELVYITTIVSLIWLLIYLYLIFKKCTFCRGFKYYEHSEFYLFISNANYYIPLKLKRNYGNIHQFMMIQELVPDQIKLIKHFWWDVLKIEWRDTIVLRREKQVIMPHEIIIPIMDKFRIRRMVESPQFTTNILIKQRHTWYPLKGTKKTTYIRNYRKLPTVPSEPEIPIPSATATVTVNEEDQAIQISHILENRSMDTNIDF